MKGVVDAGETQNESERVFRKMTTFPRNLHTFIQPCIVFMLANVSLRGGGVLLLFRQHHFQLTWKLW